MTQKMPSEHPDRHSIMDEVHARPIHIVSKAARVRRLMFIVSDLPDAMAQIMREFSKFCTAQGLPEPRAEERQHNFNVRGHQVTWEFHTEFVTITWYSDLKDTDNFPDFIGINVLASAYLIGATRIDVIPKAKVPESLLNGFELTSLCLAEIENAKGQIATDFVADSDLFTRFEFAGSAISELRRSIVVRKLLEVETYRLMAFLGLPLARRLSPELRRVETKLTSVIETLSAATDIKKVQIALEALHALSVHSGKLSEQLGFRFAASQAYGTILNDRLARLNEKTTDLGLTMANYLGNRINPALATFSAMDKRLHVLSTKIDRGIELLDVRIGLDLQIQNKTVLETIARTAKRQFQLQRTVEGLSTIAISYYLLGILSHMLNGPSEALGLDKTMIVSIAAPFTLLAIWLLVRKVRNSHLPL